MQGTIPKIDFGLMENPQLILVINVDEWSKS